MCHRRIVTISFRMEFKRGENICQLTRRASVVFKGETRCLRSVKHLSGSNFHDLAIPNIASLNSLPTLSSRPQLASTVVSLHPAKILKLVLFPCLHLKRIIITLILRDFSFIQLLGLVHQDGIVKQFGPFHPGYDSGYTIKTKEYERHLSYSTSRFLPHGDIQ